MKINKYKKDLDDIADYILLMTNVDVRKNTSSRKYNLPEYRFLFFGIAYETLEISLEMLGSYLDKDHTTVIHAIKQFNLYVKDHFKEVCSNYIIGFEKKETERDFKTLSEHEKIRILKRTLSLQKLNHKKEIEDLKKIINNTSHVIFQDLMKIDEETINFFYETRFKPFTKMLQYDRTKTLQQR